MSGFGITNVQGIVSKAALAGQVQDGANRGHELAAEHASKSMQEEHEINLEKVSETNKPEESMDRDANPEDMRDQEGEEDNKDEEDDAVENTPPLPPGHPDASGHIDLTA